MGTLSTARISRKTSDREINEKQRIHLRPSQNFIHACIYSRILTAEVLPLSRSLTQIAWRNGATRLDAATDLEKRPDWKEEEIKKGLLSNGISRLAKLALKTIIFASK